jgi:hypothetical protein
MKLVKEHKILSEYAEVDAHGAPVFKPRLSPIYLRKGTFEILPNTLSLTITAES